MSDAIVLRVIELGTYCDSHVSSRSQLSPGHKVGGARRLTYEGVRICQRDVRTRSLTSGRFVDGGWYGLGSITGDFCAHIFDADVHIAGFV